MDHPAIPVRDEERSRPFHETYFGFDARPAQSYDDGVLMLDNAARFALALGRSEEPIARPSWMHFGIELPHRDALLALRAPAFRGWHRAGRGVGRARICQRQVPRSGWLHRRGGVGPGAVRAPMASP
jgi:hypothetical protein